MVLYAHAVGVASWVRAKHTRMYLPRPYIGRQGQEDVEIVHIVETLPDDQQVGVDALYMFTVTARDSKNFTNVRSTTS